MTSTSSRSKFKVLPVVRPASIKAPLVSSDGLRVDGRALEEARAAFFKTSSVSQARGSAYVEFGDSKAIVSVFGPRESRRSEMGSASSSSSSSGGGSEQQGAVACDVRIAPFAMPRGGVAQPDPSSLERLLSSHLHSALLPAVQRQHFPKATLDVRALLLELGGADLSAIINAASLALADAGVPLADLVSSATVVCVGGRLFLDPSLQEERKQEGRLVLACMQGVAAVNTCAFTGDLPLQKLNEALDLALAACSQMDLDLRAFIREGAVEDDDEMT